jgi:hypothetical protein
MNRFGKIAVWMASAVALNASLCLCRGVLSNNPYEPIVTRNVFDINPPQANAAPPPAEPPSKITPDGIMTIFGSKQVLFYVDVPPHPPQPATQKSYILSEGQQQDDIEVTRIDDKNGVVTFNNHGVMQEIPLVKAGPITTPTPVVMNTSFAPPAPNYGFNGGGNAPGTANRFGQSRNFGSTARSFGNNNGSYGNNNNGNVGGPAYANAGGSSTAQTSQPPLSPEQQTVLIAAEKAQAKAAGDPSWIIYPPTPLDKDAGTVNSSEGPSSP